MLKFLCLALIAGLTSAAITLKDCGHGEVKSFQIKDIDDEYTLTVDFVAHQESKKADLHITTDSGDINTDGCDAHLKCPLKKGEIYRLEYKMPSNTTAKTINAGVRVNITGEPDVIACGYIHGTIISSII